MIEHRIVEPADCTACVADLADLAPMGLPEALLAFYVLGATHTPLELCAAHRLAVDVIGRSCEFIMRRRELPPP